MIYTYHDKCNMALRQEDFAKKECQNCGEKLEGDSYGEGHLLGGGISSSLFQIYKNKRGEIKHYSSLNNIKNPDILWGLIDYSLLQELREKEEARIIETKPELASQLWEVDGADDNYVVLSDNTVITQTEDKEDNPIF